MQCQIEMLFDDNHGDLLGQHDQALDRGKTLTQRLNSLALSQEAHIAEYYGNKATADLKRLLESLIEKAN